MSYPQAEQEKDSICPFLGLPTDWQTNMGYPSRQNFCRRVKPIFTPEEEHQREFCLSPTFPQCPKYSSQSNSVIPKIPGPRPIKSGIQNPLLGWIILGLILVIVFLLVLWLLISRTIPAISTLKISPATPFEIQTYAVVHPTEFIPASTLPLTDTPVIIDTTVPAVVEPPLIQVELPSPHLVEVPFGSELPLLLHLVKGGEDLISIANNYQTSVEAIRAINFKMPQELWSDTVIVIPVGQIEVTGVPAFTTLEILADGFSVESLAAEQGIDPGSLARYNERPADYFFQKGEWVVLPQLNPAP